MAALTDRLTGPDGRPTGGRLTDAGFAEARALRTRPRLANPGFSVLAAADTPARRAEVEALVGQSDEPAALREHGRTLDAVMGRAYHTPHPPPAGPPR